MTATAADDRTLLPGPASPPPASPTSSPLAERRPVVLADDPCEAGFSGADPEYAGIYLHARYFDPKLGIFLSPDPIGVAGGMSLYGYAFGDPVNGTDRSGLLLDAGLWCFQIVVHDHWTTVCVPTGGGGGGGTTGGGAGTGSNGEKGKGVCTGTCKDKEEPKKEEPPVVTPPKEDKKRDATCQLVYPQERFWQNLEMTKGGLLHAGAEAVAGAADAATFASGVAMMATGGAISTAKFTAGLSVGGQIARGSGLPTFTNAIETFLLGSPNGTVAPGGLALLGSQLVSATVVGAAKAGLSGPAFALGTAAGAYLEAAGPRGWTTSPVGAAVAMAVPQCR